MPQPHPFGHPLIFALFLFLVLLDVLVALLVGQSSSGGFSGAPTGHRLIPVAFGLVGLRIYIVGLFGAGLTWSLADSCQGVFVILLNVVVVLGAAYALQWHSSLAVFLLLVGVIAFLSLVLCPRPADLTGFSMSLLFILSAQSGILYLFGTLLDLAYIRQVLQFEVVGIVFDVRVLFGTLFVVLTLIRAVNAALKEPWAEVQDLWPLAPTVPSASNTVAGMINAPILWFIFVLISVLRVIVNWLWFFFSKTWFGIVYISDAFVRQIWDLLGNLSIWYAILKPMVTFLLLLGYFRVLDAMLPSAVAYLLHDGIVGFPWGAAGSLLLLFTTTAALAAIAGSLWTEIPWHDLVGRTASFAVTLIMSFALASVILTSLFSRVMAAPPKGFSHFGPLALGLATIIGLVLLVKLGERFAPVLEPGVGGGTAAADWGERMLAAVRRGGIALGARFRSSPVLSFGLLAVAVAFVMAVVLVRPSSPEPLPAPVAEAMPLLPVRKSSVLPLRSEPIELADKDVETALRRLSFFDAKRSPQGRFRNDLAAGTGGVVIDRATGIFWQQGGSDSYMTYVEAQRSVEEMNQRSFAGYRDWRLPTVEEAASLLTVSQQNEELHVDRRFDSRQRRIWTADAASPDGAWRVDFAEGSLVWSARDYRHFVRACRTPASVIQ